MTAVAYIGDLYQIVALLLILLRHFRKNEIQSRWQGLVPEETKKAGQIITTCPAIWYKDFAVIEYEPRYSILGQSGALHRGLFQALQGAQPQAGRRAFNELNH